MSRIITRIFVLVLSSFLSAAEPTIRVDLGAGVVRFQGRKSSKSLPIVQAFGQQVRQDSVMGYEWEEDGQGRVRFFVSLFIDMTRDIHQVNIEEWSFYIYDSDQDKDPVFGDRVMIGKFNGDVKVIEKGDRIIVNISNLPGIGNFGHPHSFKLKHLKIE